MFSSIGDTLQHVISSKFSRNLFGIPLKALQFLSLQTNLNDDVIKDSIYQSSNWDPILGCMLSTLQYCRASIHIRLGVAPFRKKRLITKHHLIRVFYVQNNNVYKGDMCLRKKIRMLCLVILRKCNPMAQLRTQLEPDSDMVFAALDFGNPAFICLGASDTCPRTIRRVHQTALLKGSNGQRHLRIVFFNHFLLY